MNRAQLLRAAALCFLLGGCESGEDSLELGQERLSEREAENTTAMIDAIKAISLRRYPSGTLRRFNQSKTLACYNASFAVPQDLAEEFQKGIFIPGANYRAQIRFANASQIDDRKKDFRGMSIKLSGLSGESLWGTAGQQDFLLNSYPALFAANPADFLDFISASADDKLWRYFINPLHFYSLGIVLKGREKIDNPFAIQYWSTTPYRFGHDTRTAVKYSVLPCADSVPELNTTKHENFLRNAMREHLERVPACFEFMVQFQHDPVSMPIEDAAVVWEEARAPFITLARIRIEAGAGPEAIDNNCEAMTFNPWQSLAEHRPLGGINRTRRPIYAEIGAFRQRENNRRGSHSQD